MNTLVKQSRNAIVWLSLAHLFCDVYGGFLNPLMPFIAEKLGFSMAIATILMAITQICSNMLQPIFGFFADNILKRFFIFWGLILASTFIPLAPSAPNLFILTFFAQKMGRFNLPPHLFYQRVTSLLLSADSWIDCMISVRWRA